MMRDASTLWAGNGRMLVHRRGLRQGLADLAASLSRQAWTLLLMGSLTACTLPNAGPTAEQVNAAAKPTPTGETPFDLVDVDANVVTTMGRWTATSLQGSFGTTRPATRQAIGVGDSVQ